MKRSLRTRLAQSWTGTDGPATHPAPTQTKQLITGWLSDFLQGSQCSHPHHQPHGVWCHLRLSLPMSGVSLPPTHPRNPASLFLAVSLGFCLFFSLPFCLLLSTSLFLSPSHFFLCALVCVPMTGPKVNVFPLTKALGALRS